VGWADWFGTDDYDVAREILLRGFAAIFVVALVSALAQFPALLGEHGLTPVPRFVARTTWRSGPSLFRLAYSDRLLRVCAWCGILLAGSVVVGLAQAGPWWVPTIVFLALWAVYLSIVNVGQTFYAFGWESLLCEAGFLMAFLGSDRVATPVTTLVLARWLLFRLEFGAGLIKIRGDVAWRDLTAMYYHQETQPMPGPLSWQAHHLPRWWHRAEVVGNHVAQLGAPLLLAAPQPVASIGAGVMVLTQLWLVATGNFSWLNWAAIVLALGAVSDGVWARVLPSVPDDAALAAGSRPPDDVPVAYAVVVGLAAVLLLVKSRRPLLNLFARHQLMNASFDRYRLVNAYGAFGSITRRRFEVVVEGVRAVGPRDARGSREPAWLEYGFRGKPGDVARRPPQVAPYHLRLDWLMWFLALRGYDDTWFEVFLLRLLEADRPTLRLLRHDPFEGERPDAVRATLYRYRFTTRAERRASGAFWVREQVATLVPSVTLADPHRAAR
jgi:hypothetical protein